MAYLSSAIVMSALGAYFSVPIFSGNFASNILPHVPQRIFVNRLSSPSFQSLYSCHIRVIQLTGGFIWI